MRVDRPPPGEELNPGPATEAREAASLILLRDGHAGPEVLLVKRNPAQRFMGGAWVFPGGANHEEDPDHAATAVRELEEEAGVRLGDSTPVPFSRWITPRQVKVRFDTWFFVAEAPTGAEAQCDGAECVDLRWIRPAEALAAGERGELMLVFPTIKHLEQLAEFGSVADALAAAAERVVEPIEPRVVARDGAGEVLLPGEPGYDDA
ncbi:MAG TPA: NUDIX domain-containing protein [Thermoleophilaceae bacterium]|nr:NUDIX domain-containing protein [Thermoleophilaceae bacterium]